MFNTTSEFKKAVKTLTKGAIKTKIFGGEAGEYTFEVCLGEYDKKEKIGRVSISIKTECGLSMTLSGDASTRVYNKVNDEFFAPITAQFEKLKTVKSVKFVI